MVGQNYSEVGNRGLFGVHNDDPSDDLTTPDGTIINSNKSEDLGYVHTEFGEKCEFLFIAKQDLFVVIATCLFGGFSRCFNACFCLA